MAFFTKTRKLIIGGTVIDVEFSKYGPESVQIGDVRYDKNSDVAKSFTSKFCQFLEENSKKDEVFAFQNSLLWENADYEAYSMLYAQEISFRKAFSNQLKQTLEKGSIKGVESILKTGIIESKSLLELAREEMEKPRGFKGAIYKVVKSALDFSLRDSIEKLAPTVDISKYTTVNHDFSREGDVQEVSKEDIMQATMLDFMKKMEETQKQLSTELDHQRKFRESQERVEAAREGEKIELKEGDKYWNTAYGKYLKGIKPSIATVLIAEEFQKNGLNVGDVSDQHEKIIQDAYKKIGIFNPNFEKKLDSEYFCYDKIEDLSLRKKLIESTQNDFDEDRSPFANKVLTKMRYLTSLTTIDEEVEKVDEQKAKLASTKEEKTTPTLTMDKLFEASANAAFDVKPQNEQEEIEQIIAQDTVNQEYQKQLDAEEQAKQSQSSSQKLN